MKTKDKIIYINHKQLYAPYQKFLIVNETNEKNEKAKVIYNDYNKNKPVDKSKYENYILTYATIKSNELLQDCYKSYSYNKRQILKKLIINECNNYSYNKYKKAERISGNTFLFTYFIISEINNQYILKVINKNSIKYYFVKNYKI